MISIDSTNFKILPYRVLHPSIPECHFGAQTQRIKSKFTQRLIPNLENFEYSQKHVYIVKKYVEFYES